eukprot:TRINITY_DN4560_c0_g2_i1.p1 TRINITY_DN4560_c0_g2~~TRINITY_DN4560_c0_g2_i1.p1  ORF type:complete len:382 (-),score=83.00 TRINITY_DN4560_c0_g2_i1:201-1346(-)
MGVLRTVLQPFINGTVRVRNFGLGLGYKILKPIFFHFDPEDVHDTMTKMGILLGKHKSTQLLTSMMMDYSHPMLAQNIHGIHFRNPIGLSAGFDKDVRLVDILPHVGFGFAEVGSITGEPCTGNPRPRLWRIPKEKSLVVYYGLKNDGCEAIVERLRHKKFQFPVGISVAKTNNETTADIDAGVADYVKAYRTMLPVGDYCTINISCPNAFGGQPFTAPDRLEKLLSAIHKLPKVKPIYMKISPDITEEEQDGIIELSRTYGVDGFICTNLTKVIDNSRGTQNDVPSYGGRSGKLVDALSDKMIASFYRKTKGEFLIIGAGGVFNAKDAYRKIRNGASLIHMITGMIFNGPQTISSINEGLVRLLKQDGFSHISEAVGVDV